MNTRLSDIAINSFVSGIDTLKTACERLAAYADDRKIAPEVLLESRLFPDMYSYRQQVQAALVMAEKGVARLLDAEPPASPGDATSVEELLQRLGRTREVIAGADREKIDAGADRVFTVPMGPGVEMEFSARAYMMSFSVPNFLFHVTCAYAILRSCGVTLDKRDYLGPFIECWTR